MLKQLAIKFKNINTLDYLLIGFLLLILLAFATKEAVGFEFAETLRTAFFFLNPLNFFDPNEVSVGYKVAKFLESLQGILWLLVFVSVLGGKRLLASILAFVSVLCGLLLPAIAFGIFEPQGFQFYIDGTLSNREWSTQDESVKNAFVVLKEISSGIGLWLFVAFLGFYVWKRVPRKVKPTTVQESYSLENAVVNKADFCPKCGSAASDGDFCSKCGNGLMGISGKSGLSNSYASGRTSPLAIAAIITVFFVSWVGIVLGYLARKEIRESNGQLGGDGLAKAAIIIGWVATGLAVLVGIIWAVAIGVAAGNAYSY